ncbi:glucosamine-6-phosphate deaminase [Rickettsiales bacterium LUAb2]
MRLIITDKVGLYAAKYIKNLININNQQKANTVLGLPTGSTPLTMYKALIKMYQQQQLSFKNVVTFNMDEYIGLAADHPQSYNYYMQQNFFNHVDIDKQNINIPNGIANDIKQECIDYEAKIVKAKKINLFVGGVGEDGHLAFNEPYSSLSSKTRDKDLDHSTILANARFFSNKKEVPTKAITVGIDTIMEAQEVMILISGYNKAKVLCYLLEGAISHVYPISILQMHPKAIIVADEEACSELKVKTYKYFQNMKDEYSNLIED